MGHRIEVAAQTHTGVRRTENEDCLGAFEDLGLFAVADGMGGHSSGEVASRMAIDAIRAHYATTAGATRADEQARLAAAFSSANQRIFTAALQQRTLRGMGTTLVAASVHPSGLHVAHVGDSRAYRLRGGALEALTEDHSLVTELLRAGHLRPEQVASFARRNVVTRALGLRLFVVAETRFEEPRAGDLVLLCSDGLNAVVADDEIADVLRSATELGAMASRLIAAANDRGGPDNVTVLLLRWST